MTPVKQNIERRAVREALKHKECREKSNCEVNHQLIQAMDILTQLVDCEKEYPAAINTRTENYFKASKHRRLLMIHAELVVSKYRKLTEGDQYENETTG